jgi:hypothetical protein
MKDILISLIVALVIAIPSLIAMFEQEHADLKARKKRLQLIKKTKFAIN